MLFRTTLLLLCVSNAMPAFSLTYHLSPPHRFETWYSNQDDFQITSSETCNVTLKNYRDSFGKPEVPGRRSPCGLHVDCILDHTVEYVKANSAAATVLLGLMPGILASIGPTLAEVALISHERPILAFFLSIGALTVYPDRIFEYKPPAQALAHHNDVFSISKQYLYKEILISILEYVLAGGAIVNILLALLDLASKTVTPYTCSMSYLAPLWGVLPVVIYIFAVWSYWISKSAKERRKDIQNPKSRTCWLVDKLLDEPRICANRDKYKLENHKKKESSFVIMLNAFASALGIVHIAAGAFIFSSLLFISVQDTFGLIFRLGASVITCRLVLMFEIAGLRVS